MQLRTRTVRTTVVGAVALAAVGAGVVALSGSAQAGTEPPHGVAARQAAAAFLEPGDLPPASTDWTADPVADGLPADLTCLVGTLPEENVQHRQFRTELDTNATQVIVEADDEQAARQLLANTEDALRECADAYDAMYPDGDFTGKDYGAVNAGDAAHVYGLESEFAHGSLDAHLFGVGRDGTRVTVTVLGQLGRLSDTPVEEFKDTTRVSVTKLAG